MPRRCIPRRGRGTTGSGCCLQRTRSTARLPTGAQLPLQALQAAGEAADRLGELVLGDDERG